MTIFSPSSINRSGIVNVRVNQEIKEILAENRWEEKIITEEMIKGLPIPVQRWLESSGVIGKEQIQTVYLKQKGLSRVAFS